MNVRIPRVSIFKIALLGALWCSACASDTPTDLNPLGTETNWLKACQSDAECGDLSCECGICTDPCTTDSQCTAPGAKCRASDGPEVNGLCAASAQTAALCLPTCTASCDADEVCLGARCVAPAGTSSDASLGDASPADTGTVATGSGSTASSSTSAASSTTGSSDAAGAEVDAGGEVDAAPSVSVDAGEPNACPAGLDVPQDGCCWSDANCAGSDVCYQADCSAETPVPGRCGTPPEGSCFGDRDCASGEVCNGGSLALCGTLGPDSLGTCEPTTCEFDSCHPERCDAVGEPCCDPLPGDGPNYCNNGLTCGAGGCEDPAAEDGPLCGATQCAADEVCCDRCAGACVSMFAELLCAEDDRPATFTCEGEAPAFYCGPSTVCSDPTSQYCRIFQGGLPGPPSYDCLDLPVECAADPTCECTLQNISDPGAQCETGPNGELTVTPLPAP